MEKEQFDMEKKVRELIADLRRRVVSEVPEFGEFEIVHEEFKNLDTSIEVTDIMLKVTKPPIGLEGNERERYLELVLYNLPTNPYKNESVVGFGLKKDILAKLDQEELVNTIMRKIPQMARDLNDIW